jgi:hypothetical protein
MRPPSFTPRSARRTGSALLRRSSPTSPATRASASVRLSGRLLSGRSRRRLQTPPSDIRGALLRPLDALRLVARVPQREADTGRRHLKLAFDPLQDLGRGRGLAAFGLEFVHRRADRSVPLGLLALPKRSPGPTASGRVCTAAVGRSASAIRRVDRDASWLGAPPPAKFLRGSRPRSSTRNARSEPCRSRSAVPTISAPGFDVRTRLRRTCAGSHPLTVSCPSRLPHQ